MSYTDFTQEERYQIYALMKAGRRHPPSSPGHAQVGAVPQPAGCSYRPTLSGRGACSPSRRAPRITRRQWHVVAVPLAQDWSPWHIIKYTLEKVLA